MDDLTARLRAAADKSANGGGEWYHLVHRCHEAADRIDADARRIATLEALAGEDVTYRDLEVKMRDGTVDLRVVFGEEGGSPAGRLLAALMLNVVLGDDVEPVEPPNYRCAEVRMKPAGEFEPFRTFLEVVKPGGKSSHEIRLELEAERDAALADVAKLREALTAVADPGHQLLLSLVAVEHHLRKPYPDDPRWTPWSRFIEPYLSDIGAAVSSARAALAEEVGGGD